MPLGLVPGSPPRRGRPWQVLADTCSDNTTSWSLRVFQTMEPTATRSCWEGIELNSWHCPKQKLGTWPEMQTFTGKGITDLLRASFKSQQVDRAVGEAAFPCFALIHVLEECNLKMHINSTLIPAHPVAAELGPTIKSRDACSH